LIEGTVVPQDTVQVLVRAQL